MALARASAAYCPVSASVSETADVTRMALTGVLKPGWIRPKKRGRSPCSASTGRGSTVRDRDVLTRRAFIGRVAAGVAMSLPSFGAADAGKMAPVDGRHLLFLIWAMTQTYADFDVQVAAVLGRDRVAPRDYQEATALITRLAEIVCHDNFTEMHAFKHHQAIVEEFYATREPWRWLHLVSGAQAAAISFGKNMEIYEEALELLHA